MLLTVIQSFVLLHLLVLTVLFSSLNIQRLGKARNREVFLLVAKISDNLYGSMCAVQTILFG